MEKIILIERDVGGCNMFQFISSNKLEPIRINKMTRAVNKFIEDTNKESSKQEAFYYHYIFKVLIENFLEECPFSKEAEYFLYHNDVTIDEFSRIAHLISEGKIDDDITSAINKCKKLITSGEVQILILPLVSKHFDQGIREYGVVGYAPGKGKIIILADPSSENFKEKLTYAIAHEYYHNIWFKGYTGNKFTLLDYLIFEGKADTFARILYPDFLPPWLGSSDSRRMMQLLNKIKGKLKSRNQDLLRNVMFGSDEYPISGGYALGYYILKTFIEGHSIKEWTSKSPEHILDTSNLML